MPRVLCGRCGSIVLEGPTLLAIRAEGREPVEAPLCPSCADQLRGWVRAARPELGTLGDREALSVAGRG